MPTGVLATLGGYVPRQNARMLQMLLAKHGGIFILHDDFEKLPLYLQTGLHPDHDAACRRSGTGRSRARAAASRQHRTDAGVFLSAEVLGVQARASSSRTRTGSTPTIRRRTRARRTSRASRAKELHRSATSPDVVVERIVIEYLHARALVHTSCRSSTGSSPARSRAPSRARMSARSSTRTNWTYGLDLRKVSGWQLTVTQPTRIVY